MEKYYKEYHEHHPVRCCKQCIGAFNVEHRIYEVRCIEVVRVCPCCGFEHDHRRHRQCPRCGMNVHEFIQNRFALQEGLAPE